jgi:hypothetical protein
MRPCGRSPAAAVPPTRQPSAVEQSWQQPCLLRPPAAPLVRRRTCTVPCVSTSPCMCTWDVGVHRGRNLRSLYTEHQCALLWSKSIFLVKTLHQCVISAFMLIRAHGHAWPPQRLQQTRIIMYSRLRQLSRHGAYRYGRYSFKLQEVALLQRCTLGQCPRGSCPPKCSPIFWTTESGSKPQHRHRLPPIPLPAQQLAKVPPCCFFLSRLLSVMRAGFSAWLPARCGCVGVVK